jgi:very-short-patch-repair endonuclease
MSEELTERARDLRRTMTDAERRLWRELRLEALGARFRRQVPIGSYIVDFACLECKLIVEVDGGQHLESSADTVRDQFLRGQGFRILRFWNHDVLQNTRGVLEAICAKLGRRGRTERPPT